MVVGEQADRREENMLDTLKKVIKRSALAPLAASVYGLALPAERRCAMHRNLRYDRETIEVMRRVLTAQSSCIDIGAHDGEILRHITKLAPQGRHVAFEPIPRLAAALRAGFPGVTVHEAACADRAGSAQFVLVENAPAYSGLRQRLYDRPDVALRNIHVQVVRVDELVKHAVCLIKVDVEGGEYHALLGAQRTIALHGPVVIFEAGARSTGQYGVTPRDFTALFARLGYRLSTMERWLASKPAFTDEEFAANWRDDRDYYFIAHPSLTC
jgi:FkbM family methyltransferase